MMVEPDRVMPVVPVRSEKLRELIRFAIKTGDPSRFNECACGYMLVRKHGSVPPFHFRMVRVDQIVDVDQQNNCTALWCKGNNVNLTEMRVLDSMETMCVQVVEANDQLLRFAIMIGSMQGSRLLELVEEACRGIALEGLAERMSPMIQAMIATGIDDYVPGALAKELEAASVRLEADRLADADAGDAADDDPPDDAPSDPLVVEASAEEQAVTAASKPPKRTRKR